MKKRFLSIALLLCLPASIFSMKTGLAILAYEYKLTSDLIEAVEENNVEKVKELVNSGADLNGRNKRGNTALSIAVWREKYEIADYLIEKGADLSLEYGTSGTLLDVASMYGDIKTVKYLIGKGVDLNRKNSEGNPTAVCYATSLCRMDVVKEFIKAGVNLFDNIYDAGHGKTETLLHNAVFSSSVYKPSGPLEVIKAVIEDSFFSLPKVEAKIEEGAIPSLVTLCTLYIAKNSIKFFQIR